MDRKDCYWKHSIIRETDTQKPKIDGLYDGSNLQGCPVGGIGTGGISRDYTGSFRRWTIRHGVIKHFVEPVNNFSVRYTDKNGDICSTVLQNSYPEETQNESVKNWYKNSVQVQGEYSALFPKAEINYTFTNQPELQIKCEQFSPVVPNNYKDSSLPLGNYRWKLKNTGSKKQTAALMFSFVNMNGWFDELNRGLPYKMSRSNFNSLIENNKILGIAFDHKRISDLPQPNRGQMGIGVSKSDQFSMSYCLSFDTQSQTENLWNDFDRQGHLNNTNTNWITSSEFASHSTGHIAGAIAVNCELNPGEEKECEMFLVWDFPVSVFGNGRRYLRKYTQFFGENGTNAEAIMSYASENASIWTNEIGSWHDKIISKSNRPDYYYTLLFNELYLLIDGMTVWSAKTLDPRPKTEEFFAVLECPDYPYYNTFDLWVYASFAILPNWPELEKNVINTYGRTVIFEDKTARKHLQSNKVFNVKTYGMVPHDLGAPDEDPFYLINGYNYQNMNKWKDLNSQFILTVYRDFKITKDEEIIKSNYDAVLAAHDKLKQFDRDGDGVIENDDEPDQTFDNIPMKGISAYCGGLWLAATAAVSEMANIMNDTAVKQKAESILSKGKESFVNALWNGNYFDIDSAGSFKNKVFIEQLFGIWYAKILDLKNIVSDDKIQKALQTVYKENYLNVNPIKGSAINISGFSEEDKKRVGEQGDSECQSSEVLTGINYSFATQLKTFGFEKESMSVLNSIYKMIYENKQLWFRTPAAMDIETETFRAIMNLRPLMIWAMEFEILN